MNETVDNLLSAAFQNPGLLKSNAVRVELAKAADCKNSSELSMALFDHYVSRHPNERPRLLKLASGRNLGFVVTSVTNSEVSSRLAPARCLTDEVPDAVKSRAEISPDRPELSVLSSRDQLINVAFHHGFPVVSLAANGAHSPIIELSDPHSEMLNIRGGSQYFDRNVVNIDKLIVIHDQFGGNNHAHWLLDWLPRFALFKKNNEEIANYKLVNPLTLNHVQITCLNAVGFPIENVLTLSRPTVDSPINFRTKMVLGTSSSGADLRHPLQHGSPWAFEFVRSLFMKKKSEAKNNKIILNRRNTRRLQLESEGRDELAARGFVEVYLEDLTFIDQVMIFQNAETIVAAHGAGLANLIFCNEKTKIFEIFPEGYSTAAFFVVSRALELNYTCAVGRSIDRDQASHPRDPDIYVSTSLIRSFFRN